jgi:phytoene dehydrogenase-like protein
VIVSNATPYLTFNKLLGKLKEDKKYDSLYNEINSVSYESPVTKINIAVNKLPTFSCLPTEGKHLATTIHINSSSLGEIETAYKEYQEGRCSTKPIIEMTIPSVLDNTLAPKGHHIINLFT